LNEPKCIVFQGWQNEKLCPELLVPLTEEVESMQEQLVNMENNLKRLNKTDLRLTLHKLELSRIRFVLVSYLRIRLYKIQEFAWYIQESENRREREEPAKLMAQEQKFLKE
jgi:GINS complex subunit 4